MILNVPSLSILKNISPLSGSESCFATEKGIADPIRLDSNLAESGNILMEAQFRIGSEKAENGEWINLRETLDDRQIESSINVRIIEGWISE
jgi:hypothetical protein